MAKIGSTGIVRDFRKDGCRSTHRFLFVVFTNMEYFFKKNIIVGFYAYQRSVVKYAEPCKNPFCRSWRRRGR
jgi:hypothetical protein